MPKKVAKIKIICQTCGKEFDVHPWRQFIAKFCCKECHNLEFKKVMLKRCQDHPVPKIKKVCKNEFCKKEFTVRPNRMTAKFCCHKCLLYYKSREYKDKIEERDKIKEIVTINKIWSL